MITQDEIERKNFSGALPRIITTLESIGYLLNESAFHGLDFGSAKSDLQGIGYIMSGAAEELTIINKGLYGSGGEKKAAPEPEA